jgi:hypothetical protein
MQKRIQGVLTKGLLVNKESSTRTNINDQVAVSSVLAFKSSATLLLVVL